MEFDEVLRENTVRVLKAWNRLKTLKSENRIDDRTYNEKKERIDKQYYVDMIDRVGAGDAYTAGFLYGYLADGPQAGVKYGNGLSAINHTIPGDLAWVTRAEVEAQIGGAGSRIQR